MLEAKAARVPDAIPSSEREQVRVYQEKFAKWKHIDSPENNPDMPWEFTETNMKKVMLYPVLCGFLELISVLR
ncbi:hypothetical protein GUJ93_ZPchr0011g28569 [Zizania palustris]|uniref:Uncharacterized protein n=1 Tax=Zizania palustris TaxID=103762 RepID=A0A8J5WGC3_ZIZPA|nr:hypothetical protein GUJ93_ZPchr0011g28569 [Zizania palustris]